MEVPEEISELFVCVGYAEGGAGEEERGELGGADEETSENGGDEDVGFFGVDG